MNEINSGLDGSRILIGDGMDQFDPDSLVEDVNQPNTQENTSIVILSLDPPDGSEELKVGALFESIETAKNNLCLSLVVLLPIAIELSSLVFARFKTKLNWLEFREPNISPTKLNPPNLSLFSVQFENSSNNRVKTKLIFRRYEH